MFPSFPSYKEGSGGRGQIEPGPPVHKAVTKDTIARWVKSILQQSGIDTDKFTCHSTRAASTSCVKAAGLNLKQIMQSAGWSNSSTFAKFYDKHIETENFGSTILNTAVVETVTTV